MLHSIKKGVVVVAGLAALALGGSALAGAASSSSTSANTTQGTTGTQAPPAFNGPAHGTAAHEDAEKAVTGDAAAKAQAAAVKSVGSGTAGPVTTDFTGNGFETTVTKADGTKVEVHLDSSYNVMQGPGHPGWHRGSGGPGGPGGPGGSGGPGGPPPAA
jgi:nicotinic acid phosphoribosyltransferase